MRTKLYQSDTNIFITSAVVVALSHCLIRESFCDT